MIETRIGLYSELVTNVFSIIVLDNNHQSQYELYYYLIFSVQFSVANLKSHSLWQNHKNLY